MFCPETGRVVTPQLGTGGGRFMPFGSGLVSPRGLCDMCEHGEMVVECSGRLLGLEWVESRPMGRCSDRKEAGW